MLRSLCDHGIVSGLKERVCRDSLGVPSPYIRGSAKAEDEVDLNTGISDFAEGKLFKA